MKHLIILGGNNNHNIKWLKKMKSTYQKDYDVTILFYDHWDNNTDMNFDLEINKLKKLMNENKESIIVAKSAGAVLSLIAVSRGIINPKKLIIMGLPLKFTERNGIDIKKLLFIAQKKLDILIIQQKNDPLGKVKEVKNIISGNIKLVEINGNYHTYTKYEDIKNIVDNFIN